MDHAAAEKLCAIREKVANLIGANPFRTWFGGGTDFQLSGDHLNVTVANAFVGNWISSNYLPHLIEATRHVVGSEPRVAIHVGQPAPHCADAPATPPCATDVRHRPPRPAVASRGHPVLRGELDAFVVGPCNELAFSVVSALVKAPGQSFKHLVVHGGCGLGKTHLLQGICNGVDRVRPGLAWRYLSGEEFTNEFISAFKAGRIDLFRARFRHVDLLVVDDIHFLADKKATQEEFLHTFNAIDAVGKTVVLSSDRHPRSITQLSEPLVNRLIAAMVVEVKPPDFATRREILRRRAAAMLCELPNDVLDYLAQHITRNVRELEGALYNLVAIASLTREPIGLTLARRTIEDYRPSPRPPKSAQIERVVGNYFGISPEALRSKSRDRTVTQARSVAMFLIRRHTNMSFPEIGRLMGNKQHSTALMAVRRVQEALDHGEGFTWHTASGPREVAAKEAIEHLEQLFTHSRKD